MKAERIQKENISMLQFPAEDVLEEKSVKRERYSMLQHAMRFGNSIRHKVQIFFRDADRERVVETTVWFASDKHAVLKGGIVLPVKRIVRVEL